MTYARSLFRVTSLIGVLVLIFSTQTAGQQRSIEEHTAWVAHVLEKMQTIKPGMTRAELLKIFTGEGGLSTRLRRTFVSRDCPYFKVDVEFRAVGQPSLFDDNRDVVVSISRPYLQFSILD